MWRWQISTFPPLLHLAVICQGVFVCLFLSTWFFFSFLRGLGGAHALPGAGRSGWQKSKLRSNVINWTCVSDFFSLSSSFSAFPIREFTALFLFAYRPAPVSMKIHYEWIFSHAGVIVPKGPCCICCFFLLFFSLIPLVSLMYKQKKKKNKGVEEGVLGSLRR